MNYNPFVIQTLSILKNHKDATQYNEFPLKFQTQSYYPYAQKNMGLSNTETKKVTNILKSLITESEYLNPDHTYDVDNTQSVWWGDEITWNILSYVFYKYFGILLIYISGIGKYISEGSYISWFVDIQLHKNTNVKDRAKYAIFLNGSPSTNNIGIHYHPMHYVENKKIIKLFLEIPELSQLFRCVETRKVIIPIRRFIDSPVILQEALKFEEMYVLTKKEYLDRRLKSELNRLTGLKTRLV